MRLRWLTMAVVVGTGMVSFTAHAATNTDYLAIREKTPITALPDANRITDLFTARAGQVIEVQGQVTGIFTGDKSFGYLVCVGSKQTLIFASQQDDKEIVVGNTVRILARIPARGMVLESLAVTEDNPALAQAISASPQVEVQVTTPANANIEIIPEKNVPIIRYYRAPEFTPQPATQAVTNKQPLAAQPVVVQLYAKRIQSVNDNIDSATAQKIAVCLLNESTEHGVDPRLIFALITQESRFNPKAVSSAGAMGLGQLMPGTAAALGISNPFDIQDNLCGTVRYIAGQLSRYGHLSLALAAYNAGPAAVNRYGGVPPYRETQNYVNRIWRNFANLAGLDPETGRQIASN